MLETFLDIVNSASGAGERIFRKWTSNPEKLKFLKSEGFPIDDVLLSLTEEERVKIAPLISNTRLVRRQRWRNSS